MFIFVSDFHLMDGTAGAQHVDAGVFRSVFVELAAHARAAGAQDVTIVYLGDVYDLIRTERWFDVPPAERPWGQRPSEYAIQKIMEGVVAKNEATFDILHGSLVDQFDFPNEPTRIYIPGNHDRLCAVYPTLRAMVRQDLGIAGGDEPFPYHVLDEEHGLFARHGHEWDDLNFHGSEALASDRLEPIPDEDFARTTIGDVIACEFASKLPLLALEMLPAGHPQRARIAERLRELYDVRPLSGIVRWLSYQVLHWDATAQSAVNGAIGRAAREMLAIPWVSEWLSGARRRRHEPQSRVRAAVGMLELLEALRGDRALRLATQLADRFGHPHDAYPTHARDDFKRLDKEPGLNQRIMYVLYGHTHVHAHHPVDILGNPPDEEYRMYFNTGTWRPVHRETVTRKGFASWKDITYVIVYKPGETVSGELLTHPAAAVWTGSIIAGRGRRLTTARPLEVAMFRERLQVDS
jgi:UDP-2,3-diacylglucosamine pyrophosphatase LpxH